MRVQSLFSSKVWDSKEGDQEDVLRELEHRFKLEKDLFKTISDLIWNVKLISSIPLIKRREICLNAISRLVDYKCLQHLESEINSLFEIE